MNLLALVEGRSAVLSACGLYRYRLEREGQGSGRTAVIMVNPSTADATEDDATIRKLRGFGSRNQWGRIIVGNLFAYRATDVRELATASDPVGPLNDEHLIEMIHEADRVVFAWGPPKSKLPKHLRDRWRIVWEMAVELRSDHPLCIGPTAKCGHPCHPLMLSYELPIVPWFPTQT